MWLSGVLTSTLIVVRRLVAEAKHCRGGHGGVAFRFEYMTSANGAGFRLWGRAIGFSDFVDLISFMACEASVSAVGLSARPPPVE